MIWKRYKEVITILAFLTAMVMVYFFVISRLVAEINNNKIKLREASAIQEDQQKRLGDLAQFKKDLAKLEEGEKMIQPLWEKEEAIDKGVEFIEGVEKLAESTGNTVSIDVVNAEISLERGAKNSPETIASGFPVRDFMQFKITINGTFFSLLKLLNKLENSNYYLDIISLQVSRNQDDNKEKTPEPVTKNPFDSETSGEEMATEIKDEQTISLISVVIYTKGKK